MAYGQPMPDPNFLRNVFHNVDKDRSGQISAVELQAALSNGSWKPFNPESVRLMIGMFDRDGNGTVSFEEFSSLWSYVTGWTEKFRSYDRDNSGSIDQRELSAALSSLGYRLSDRFISIMVRKFDRSKSGRIMFDDFVQLCTILQTLTGAFAQKDLDRDGLIRVQYEEFLTMVFSLQMQLIKREEKTY